MPDAGLRAAGVRLASLVCALALAGCASKPRADCAPAPPGQVGSICGFRNPEDVEAVPARQLLLVSQMGGLDGTPGSIAGLPLAAAGTPRVLWPAAGDAQAQRGPAAQEGPAAGWGDPSCPGPPDPAHFRPHGISIGPERPSRELPLGVVAHGERESVELFALSGAGASAQLHWRGCLPLPPQVSGNDLELAPDGSIAIANYMPRSGGLASLWYQIRGGLGRNTGDVLIWEPQSGFRHLPGSASPTPNGVLRSRDGQRVFAAQTGSGKLLAIDVESGSARAIDIGGHPDNLSWSASGEILVASHAAGLGFLRCVVSRGPCRSPWALFAVDPQTLAAREVLRHDGSAVGGVASAAQVGRRLYFGAVFGDRIGVAELASAELQSAGLE